MKKILFTVLLACVCGGAVASDYTYTETETITTWESVNPTLANMVLMGKILKELGDFGEDSLRAALGKVISAKRADMLEVNLHAMQIGADYE